MPTIWGHDPESIGTSISYEATIAHGNLGIVYHDCSHNFTLSFYLSNISLNQPCGQLWLYKPKDEMSDLKDNYQPMRVTDWLQTSNQNSEKWLFSTITIA